MVAVGLLMMCGGLAGPGVLRWLALGAAGVIALVVAVRALRAD